MSGTARQPGLRRRASQCLLWLLAGMAGVGGGARLRAQTPALPLEPSGIAYDRAGNLFIADRARNQVYESTVGGRLTLVAGTGVQGFGGDGAAAIAAELNAPEGVAVAADGTVYVADTGNQRVRSIDAAGVIRTFAGTGVAGFGGDGGLATAAALRQPWAVAVEPSGALLITDRGNHRLRQVSSGIISTFAGTGVQGFAGDGGAATAALLDSPAGVALMADGRVVFADEHNQRVRVVALDGTVSTLAGTGVAGFSGDGGAATAARLSHPRGLAALPDGSVLIADGENQRLRRVSASGVIDTLAGAGMQGSAAEGSAAGTAPLNLPRAVAVSPFGAAVFAEGPNRMVRALLAGGLYGPAGMVVARSSALTVSAPAQAVYGSAAVTVQVAGAAGSPQGTVTLHEGGAVAGTGVVSGGAATVPLVLNAGSHQIVAAYAGDGFNPAAAATTAITIAPASVVASANDATVAYGAPLPALTGALNGVLPKDAAAVRAVYSAPGYSAMAPVGAYPITAALTGAAAGNYTLSMAAGTGSLHVVQAGSTVTVLPPSATYAGLPMTLSATVAPTTAGLPTGTVTFADGATIIATARLSGSTATAVYLQPSSGSHALTATYSGDANFLPSVSAATVSTVAAMPDFTMTPAGAANQTVQVGTMATFPLAITASAAPFSGVVSLSASGLPANVKATFSPVAVVPGAGVATTTLSVPTALLLSRNTQLPGPRGWVWVATAALPLVLLRRRKLSPLLVWVLAGLLAAGTVGCGARVAPEAVANSRTYTITVTGTATNLAGALVAHTTAVTLTVE